MRHLKMVGSAMAALLCALMFATWAHAEGETLAASLVDPQKQAPQGAATVQVKVTGIRLIDPASAHEEPRAGEGHLHYRLDDGPVIATPVTKLSFHELSPGEHRIIVMLAGNDHKPLGPTQTVDVRIP